MKITKHKDGTYSIRNIPFKDLKDISFCLNLYKSSSENFVTNLNNFFMKTVGTFFTLKEKLLLVSGQIIMSIKTVRERNSLSLKEAKEIVDSNRVILKSIFPCLYDPKEYTSKITEEMVNSLSLAKLVQFAQYIEIIDTIEFPHSPSELLDMKDNLRSLSVELLHKPVENLGL